MLSSNIPGYVQTDKTMRQAGVLAAAGIVAIQRGRDRLREDHENALMLAERIEHNRKIDINMEDVQTNLIRMVTYRDIQRKDVIEASNIINGYCESL